jgi:putative restriction endonuclease
MEKLLAKYLNIFGKLRIDRSRGPAPHKPILLLSILQSFEFGQITSRQVYITPELVALFRTNWNLLVESNHECRFSLPFYHLKTEGFWTLIPKTGFERMLDFAASMRSFTNLNAAIEYAILGDEIFSLMIDRKSNRILQQFLIEEYFFDRRDKITQSADNQHRLFDDLENKILREPSEEYKKEIKGLMNSKDEEEIYLRGSLFKREIPKIYDNTCSISGMRIDATISVSMVDACHIVPFSVSFDDTVTNGIALCPNLHRAFDRGLISVDSSYRVVVSKHFKESNSNYRIREFEGVEIIRPKKPEFLPSVRNFEWHQEAVFGRSERSII